MTPSPTAPTHVGAVSLRLGATFSVPGAVPRVWIGVSGEKLAWLGLIPEPWQRRSNGSTYVRINLIPLHLADSLGIDLWQLDGIGHFIALDHGPRRRIGPVIRSM